MCIRDSCPPSLCSLYCATLRLRFHLDSRVRCDPDMALWPPPLRPESSLMPGSSVAAPVECPHLPGLPLHRNCSRKSTSRQSPRTCPAMCVPSRSHDTLACATVEQSIEFCGSSSSALSNDLYDVSEEKKKAAPSNSETGESELKKRSFFVARGSSSCTRKSPISVRCLRSRRFA